MNNRTPRPVARLLRAALPVLALALSVAAAGPGCDKKDGGAAPAGGGKPAAAPGTLAVVDYDRVFNEIGWFTRITQDLDGTKANYQNSIDSFERELGDIVNEKRRQIAIASKLNAIQIADLMAGKIEKLPITPEQRAELITTVQNANSLSQQVRNFGTQKLQERKTQLIGVYREALKAPVRRAAEANGASIVINVIDVPVPYFNPATDLTNKVVDDLRQAPPAVNFPDLPKKLDGLPKISLSGIPTTMPATTQPISSTPPR